MIMLDPPSPVLSLLTDDVLYIGGAGGVARQSSSAAPVPIGPVAALARTRGVLIAGGTDGIARSTDRGHTWQRATITDPVAGLAASDDVVLAATLGGGVLRSTDAGRTWQASNFGLASLDVTAVVWDAGDTVIAATATGIHRSPNSGRAWRQVAGTDAIAALAISPTGEWVAIAENGAVLWSSTGDSWSREGTLPDGLIPSAVHISQDGHVMVGTSGGILRSDDCGATWERTYDGAVHCLAENLAGVEEGLAESTDRGRSWTTSTVPGLHDLAHLVPIGDELLAWGTMTGLCGTDAPRPLAVLAAGPDGTLIASSPDGLFRSTDRGQTWSTVIDGDAGLVHLVTFRDDGQGWAASRDGRRLLRTIDGESWKSVESEWGTDEVIALCTMGETLLAATYDQSQRAARLWRSSDGEDWELTAQTPMLAPVVAMCPEPPTAVLGRTWLFGDADGGWRQGSAPSGSIRRIVGRDDLLVALTDHELAASTDRGLTWTPMVGGEKALDIAMTADALGVLFSDGTLLRRPL